MKRKIRFGMSEISDNSRVLEPIQKAAGTLSQDDVVQQKKACASVVTDGNPNISETEILPKKRRTRRGKSKRRQPYLKNRLRKSGKVITKPEAPYNSNQFLLEDHGDIEELDENLKCIDQVSTSTLTRTRDSSFSVDSDGEFYSSPDDEEEYLIKDFADQYENLQVERLHSLSKDELIKEFLMLENRMEQLSKRLRKNGDMGLDSEQVQQVESSVVEPVSSDTTELQGEIDRLTVENERLRRENEMLRSKVSLSCSSDSADSETDSSDSCSSSSSSSSSRSSSSCSLKSVNGSAMESVEVDFSQTNGQAASSVDAI